MERLPCSPERQRQCPIFQQEGECFEDTHHLFWPTSAYKTPIEKRFRRLDINKVEICRWLHNQEHGLNSSPKKPTVETMREIINEEKQKRQRRT